MTAAIDILIALSVLAVGVGIAMRMQFKSRAVPVSEEHKERMNELARKVSKPKEYGLLDFSSPMPDISHIREMLADARRERHAVLDEAILNADKPVPEVVLHLEPMPKRRVRAGVR